MPTPNEIVAMVTVTMLSDAPVAYISPYSHTTTNRMGTKVTAACLGERKPMLREMNTKREPRTSEDCISSCIAVAAVNRVMGRPVSMTHVSGWSSFASPGAS